MKTVQVFVSHTSDMARFPEGRPFVRAALDAVARAGMAPVDMQYFAARDGQPADYCRARVRGCEIYVAVVGLRYGSIVPGQAVSYTELEFEAASAAGLPRLVFLLEEAAGMTPGLADADRGPVEEFRQRLRDAGLVVRSFSSSDSLELEVFHALSELAGSGPSVVAEPPATFGQLRAEARPIQKESAGISAGPVDDRGKNKARKDTARLLTDALRLARRRQSRLPHRAHAVSGRPLTALKLFLDRDQVLKDVPGYGKRVEESTDRITLRVHPAIPLPADAPADLSDEFPLYVPRDLDSDVRTWIRDRAPHGGLVVLVGPAAAGKTRMLCEALQAELPGWQMLRPSSPQINALVRSGADLSQSVLWLNELQTFFAGEPLNAGAVEALLAGQHGPVILAGTIRGEERDRLLGKIATPAKEMNMNANAILRMPARWSGWVGGTERAVWFDVADRLSPAEQARASALAPRDPRLAIALRDAREGGIMATLACEMELIDRWRGDGAPAGQALVTAAVVARRCGHPEPVPEDVLAAIALAYLSSQGAAPEDPGWLPTALRWAQMPIMSTGEISALRPVRTAPGLVDGYGVSDILLQNSQDREYPDVTRLLGDVATWRLVLQHAAQSAVAEIALSAYNAEKLSVAEEAWQTAVGFGDARAARRLGLLYSEQDQDAAAEEWLRKAVALGSSGAMTSLADWLWHHGQPSEAEQLLTEAVELGDLSAMQHLGLLSGGQGDYQAAERWTRMSAELGNVVAMANLGSLLAKRGAYSEAEQWGLKAAELGFPGAMQNLGDLYQEGGDLDAAMTWYRRGAERGYAGARDNPRNFRPWPGEAGDDGTSEAMLGLADLLRQDGHNAEAQDWYRRGAELGDARAAAALAADFDAQGDSTEAAAWRERAAALAQANLARNQASIRAAYGEAAVLRHTAIIVAYADDLAQSGNEAEAARWYRQAASFGDTTAPDRLD